jgi:hypothetical protein
MCYLVRSAPAPARPAQVWTLNMFGNGNYPTFGARDLCVPSDVILP